MAVDLPLAHLDRLFDYTVPAGMDEAAQPGVRVRVRFAGRLVDGYLVERAASSPRPGEAGAPLRPLERVVSGEQVLTAELLQLARAVADRYAGTLADVLRLAIPPRHARAEREAPTGQPADLPPLSVPDAQAWAAYPAGPSYLRALTTGASPRVVWSALAGPGWAACLAEAVAATVAGGRGALVLVPDRGDLARLDTALTATLGRGRHVVLAADVGPQARYRRWLMVRRGVVPAVIGTRAAAFAPVVRPGLLALWDDGDDSYDEPRAPYPHAREVLALRAGLSGAGLLLGGHATTVEAAALVESGWAKGLAAPRATVRAHAPRVLATEDDASGADPLARASRLPGPAWQVARRALGRAVGGRADSEQAQPPGPVLVQVPRRGYLPLVSCHNCRAPLRCPACQGPVGVPTPGGSPCCRWCGRGLDGWSCPACRATRWRARAVGAVRTAEELGRAFPGVPVLTSSGTGLLRAVPDRPVLVVATPGAEPVAPAGYRAALLLDAWALLARPSLRAQDEALRRWLNAAALVRPADQGGRVVVAAAPDARSVQALIRWDPVGYATRELAERRAAQLPPAAHLVEVTGAPGDVARFLDTPDRPVGLEILGPLPAYADGNPSREPGLPSARAVLRTGLAGRADLLHWIRSTLAARSARKDGGPLRVRVDPTELS